MDYNISTTFKHFLLKEDHKLFFKGTSLECNMLALCIYVAKFY